MKAWYLNLGGFLALLSLSVEALAQQSSGPVQTAPAAQQGAPGWSTLIFLFGTILVMWFFVIRPQAKRQKEQKAFVDALQVGQEVLTQGGLIGKITTVGENIVSIDFGSGPTKVLKSSVVQEIKSGVVPESIQKNNP